MVKFSFKIFIFTSVLPISFIFADEIEDKLNKILTTRTFTDNFSEYAINSIVFKNNLFQLDKNGVFYKNDQGKKIPLELYFDKNSRFVIYDYHEPPEAGLPSNPLDVSAGTVKERNAFKEMVFTQRLHAIYSIKSINPTCYFAYAKTRLTSQYPLEKILALERPDHPRPLVFETDADWDEFQQDVKSLFSPFKGNESYVAIVGTSTTFFSENPSKGKNSALFETPPACIKRAQDANKTMDVYTFDTPGSERSDVDIHIFIPELANLCDKAMVPGNDGYRQVYYENTMDQCFRLSSNPAIKELVSPLRTSGGQTLRGSIVKDQALGQFLEKWTHKLSRRPLNFSVHILPDKRKGDLYKPQADFHDDPYLKGRFVIPID